MPHEQGAWVLLCVSGGAVEGADGGKPTSRGLPPAAFWGTGRREDGGDVGRSPKRDTQGTGPIGEHLREKREEEEVHREPKCGKIEMLKPLTTQEAAYEQEKL